MSIFSAIDISSSGMTAQQLRVDVISNNIANANTTQTPEGGPYRKEIPIFAEQFKSTTNGIEPAGVAVVKIAQDNAPFRLVYDPSNPQANKDGYVEMPNVNVLREMVDMIDAQRNYEANATVINDAKTMANAALQIGK
ncbi:MAG: flagellar basal body rod protein FlgC [Athalassotoga sp.]|uniref:flagellar basal body rod protein FlgC n=1 Tax=Athalassotoga sp. TaxID=2022597 RepID=UPI000CBF0CE0|nr:flagellar basal body rod protein FlgC [Mesoaciditoga lauensis]